MRFGAKRGERTPAGVAGAIARPGRRYLVALAVVAVLIAGIAYQHRDRPFDASRWASAGGSSCPHSHDRKRMIDDLEAHYARPGTSSTELRALLGKPWSIASDQGGPALGTWWIWLTGPTHDHAACSTFDVLLLDGHVVRSRQGQT